jgi:beta-mannosidase
MTLCDELGLMVWQDFMFACNLYPSTADFLSEVESEVRDNVARLSTMPALRCGAATTN